MLYVCVSCKKHVTDKLCIHVTEKYSIMTIRSQLHLKKIPFRLLQFVKRVNLRKKFEANRKNENEKKRNGENDNKLSKSGQRSLAGAKERAFNLKRAPAPSQTSPEIFSKQTLITVDKRAFLLTFFHVLLSSSCTSNFGESGSTLEVHPENLSYLSGVFIENP